MARPSPPQAAKCVRTTLRIDQMSLLIAKQKIKELAEKYEQVVKSGQLKKYSEEQTKKDFIMPLFEALGWVETFLAMR